MERAEGDRVGGEGEGRGGGGLQRITEVFQTATYLQVVAKLFDCINLISFNNRRDRIVQWKAPPHPPIPPSEAGQKRGSTM